MTAERFFTCVLRRGWQSWAWKPGPLPPSQQCFPLATVVSLPGSIRRASSMGKASLHFFINFYWSLVGLQCCVSFRRTAKCISYTYTYIRSFLDSLPIEVITDYWVAFPVLYSRFLLVIYFIHSIVYISLFFDIWGWIFLSCGEACPEHCRMLAASLASIN